MHSIAKGFINKNVNISVITLILKGLPNHEAFDDVNVYRLGFRTLLFSQIDIGINVSDLKRILENNDVVHAFSSIPSHLLVSSLKLCRSLGKLCVWQPIYIPNRFRFHRSFIVRFLGGLWDRFALPRLASYAHGIVALTSAEADYFRRYRPDLPVEVLGECVKEVNLQKDFVQEVLDSYGLSQNGYIISVGRLAWYKGYDLLVGAWRFIERDYPELKLVIVGSDWGYKRVIVDRIRKYGLKNIIMLEGIPERELHALYEGSMFVVQLSRFETFHRIALEAWSHKKPIVALDLGAATEHIRDSGGGILVGDNVGEVASAIKALIENRGVRLRMGLKGYELFKIKYSVSSYVNRLLEFYKKLYYDNKF